MNCREFQAIAADLLDGATEPREASAHRVSCEDCRAYLGDLQAIQTSLRSLTGPGAPDQLWPRIESQFAARRDGGAMTRLLRFAAAACAAVLVTVALLSSNDGGSTVDEARSRIKFEEISMSAAEEAVVDPLSRMLLSSAPSNED